MTTRTVATTRWKPNFPNIIPNSDPEPRNRRTSGKTNYNSIKKGRLCPIFKPAIISEPQPGDKLVEANH